MMQNTFLRKTAIVIIFAAALSACKPEEEKLPESTPSPAMPDKVIIEEIPAPLPERMTKSNVFLEKVNIGNMKESEVRMIIMDMASRVDVDPVDAKFDESSWKVTRGKMGKKVNVEKVLKAALDAKENKKIKLIIEKVKPAVTAKMLQSKIKVIGRFTTKLIDRTKARINNIKLASKAIDKTKVLPGEEFSFNEVVGRRTVEKGYREAPIILNTPEGPKISRGVGGGICQISTTIYNAVEKCKLEVTERHLHSKSVSYVPKGEDATVVYGGADLKFRNNRQHPIMVRVYVKKSSITVEIVENGNI